MRSSRSAAATAVLAVVAAATLTFLQTPPARAALEAFAFQVTVSAPAELTPDLRLTGFNVTGSVKTVKAEYQPPREIVVPPRPSQIPTEVPYPSTTPVPPPASNPVLVQAPVPFATVTVRLSTTPPITKTKDADAAGNFKIAITDTDLEAATGGGLVLVEAFVYQNLTVSHPGAKVTLPAASPSPNPTPTGPAQQVVPPVNESLAGTASSLMRLPQQVNGLISQVAAGAFHTCVLLADATVRCWGANGSGQVGDGTTTARNTPTQVSALTRVRKVTAGGDHTCALHSKVDPADPSKLLGGRVSCWGSNSDGQLGSEGPSTSTPREVVFSSADESIGAVDIAAGYAHTCALLADASVRCWGSNIFGQLGNSTAATGPDTPVAVKGVGTATALKGVVQLAGGLFHTCARFSSPSATGQVACWGGNESGQLGNDGTDPTERPVLAQLGEVAITGASQISAGAQHTCARTGNKLACWGGNAYGQLGDNSTTDRLTGATNPALTDVSDIGGGGFHTCLIEKQIAACSGANESGQLGDDTTASKLNYTPVIGLGGLQAETVAAGLRHSCALTTSRAIYCWGNNEFGQLGDGTAVAKKRATQVSGLESVSTVATGAAHTCALTSANNVRCWGDNAKGQIGDGTTDNDRLSPTAIPNLKAVALALGDAFSCTLGTDASVRCWGDNTSGQLGDGTLAAKSAPAAAISGLSAKAIAAGGSFACAIVDLGAAGTADDTVKCWGANGSGQLGDGTLVAKPSPTVVSGSSTVTRIFAGRAHACGIFDANTAATSDDQVRCWGDNAKGQLGDFTTTNRTNPVTVAGTQGVVGLAVGADHNCALMGNGSVRCWGDNSSGQLGDGTTNQRRQATPLGALAQVRALLAGGSHTCLLRHLGTPETGDDTIACWGSDGSGQLGNGDLVTGDVLTPPSSGIEPGVRQADAGSAHTCAAMSDGTARCWGSNAKGQLGDGTRIDRTAPISVSIS